MCGVASFAAESLITVRTLELPRPHRTDLYNAERSGMCRQARDDVDWTSEPLAALVAIMCCFFRLAHDSTAVALAAA